jgi:ABC-type nickel/cobalt efflux system permease component RcnA
VVSTALEFPPGQAGLETLRLVCHVEAQASGGVAGARLHFENSNFADRVGWREITARGDGVELLQRDVPGRSPSRRLTRYPDDLLSFPLDERQANLDIGAAGVSRRPAAGGDETTSRATPLSRGADRFTSAFAGLVSRQDFTVWFALVALAAAIALGALHALAPGHGKTIMAAYLVGQRGSFRQALLLGSTVTATHTAGVLVLGVLLSGSATFVPEHVYPWLGLASGALLAAVGGGLLRRAWRRRAINLSDQDHHHGHGHAHRHPHTPRYAHELSHGDGPGISRRALMAMGAAGGLVPSPSALVVLLGAIALGRTWFGIALVLSYGVGMALTFIIAGLLLVRARSALDRRLARAGARARTLARALPVATASLVVVAGVGLTIRALSQI